MQALHHYCKTGRTVTIEYVLFKGMNDSDEDAGRLMELLKGLPCMINVLMFNPFPGAPFERPDEERVYAFRNILLNHGLSPWSGTAGARTSMPPADSSGQSLNKSPSLQKKQDPEIIPGSCCRLPHPTAIAFIYGLK